MTIPCALLNQPGSIQISDPNNALFVTAYYNYVKSKVKVRGLAKTYYSLALDEIGIESFHEKVLLNVTFAKFFSVYQIYEFESF